MGMNWFNMYSSNTLAGSGNQHYFLTQDNKVHKGRIYFKLFAGGSYNYSLLFSNIIDCTYADGKSSYCNLICSEWELVQVTVGVCRECSAEEAVNPETVHIITFGGSQRKTVLPGEIFTSDPLKIIAQKGEYICLEIVFQGSMIPNHEESLLPVFVWEDDKWIPSKHVPFPGMIGCDRKVKKRIGFIGDSITQGIGTPVNSYTHWNALTAEAVGEDYSYWNLGLGYGRAQDAASDSAWLYKAKNLDIVVVCFGTNDIGQGRTTEEIKADLHSIVTKLKVAGVKVMIQTLPPFDWKGEQLEKWRKINCYVRNTLSAYADGMFDVVPNLLEESEEEGKAGYGTHPNEQGCRIWAKSLIPYLQEFIR